MTSKPLYHDIDLVEVGQIINFRIHNISDADMTTLSGSLGADNTGLTVYNTDDDVVYIWDGTQFVPQAVEVTGDVVFKGGVDASISLDGQVETVSGYQYVVEVAGTLSATGVTFTPETEVETGDMILFTSSTTATVFQRNDTQATESVLGNVRIATQAEANAGTNTTAVITPEKLQGKINNDKITRSYFNTHNLSIGVNSISHNLNLQDRDSFVINTMVSNSSVSFDVDSVDENTITLTTLVAVNNVKVNIIGF